MIMTAANAVSGEILSVSNKGFSYLDLRNVNQQLIEKNNELEKELLMLRKQLEEKSFDTLNFSNIFLKDVIITDSSSLNVTDSLPFPVIKDSDYEFITAEVANNSIIHTNNYITISKGYKDGLHPDMGVVSINSVAGVLMTVNKNYSIVISLLNTTLKISAKVKNTNYFGPLSWKGGDVRYAYLEELPTHSVFKVGDTIVTSGYSSYFPPGILIGIVDSYDKQHDDNFYSLKVKLATDFKSLRSVSVIENKRRAEQLEVEKEAKSHD
jgi:rod shape-determining protein MreC